MKISLQFLNGRINHVSKKVPTWYNDFASDVDNCVGICQMPERLPFSWILHIVILLLRLLCAKFIRKGVFLTHGIRQMPTRLPTWKAKSLYHVGYFLLTWFILPLKNCKDIFKYICFTLYLQQTANNWESTIIVFINHHCLWCFFSLDIRSNQFRVYLII